MILSWVLEKMSSPYSGGPYYSGTSNIELIEKNKSEFPVAFQSGSRLTYYASQFNSLEVNSSFYKLPLPATLRKWAGEVPSGFRFTLKIWREITHAKDLAFRMEDVERFMSIANQLNDKRGALLIQLPAGTRGAQIGRLDKLLRAIQALNPPQTAPEPPGPSPAGAGHPWELAVELRHPSWHAEEIHSLLTGHGAALVWHDRPVMEEVWNFVREPFVYLRFHGPAGDYKGSYAEPFLADKAQFIRECIVQGKTVYAYFNNTMFGDAPRDLVTLNRMVAG
ncbi:MAG: DUF72 domain-containing protein [Bacteroidota bacterium]|nr:DUF72 domain-containing protein [Bacteroidota bacterium]